MVAGVSLTGVHLLLTCGSLRGLDESLAGLRAYGERGHTGAGTMRSVRRTA